MFSRHVSSRLQTSFVAVLCAAFVSACRAGADFQITPAAVTLDGNFARAQLVVSEREKDGMSERSADRTHQARYASS
ncbi:MAG: hypothetical protein ACRELG_29915, partial [Gemmataceae bacterium]